MTKKVVLSSLKANLSREKNGDWVPYPSWPGVSFNVSALTDPAYESARDLMFKTLAEKYGDERIPREVLSVELGKLYSEHILHDWRGFDVEYTADVARETLGDPEHRAVVSAVEFCASKLSEIEPQFTKAEEGNS
ncbi:UNVERIFIED_ORG: hypothetical protein LHK14_18030 [Roseateles sp. XES5]|nr:hypothetical protein [Roseateles sp. XES5]